MKKQILILMLAVFASVTVWSQAVNNSVPRPVLCASGPLNPIAGQPYNYQANADPAGGDAYWYSTFSTNFLAAGVRVAAEEVAGGAVVSAATNYMTPLVGVSNPFGTNITWTSSALTRAVTDPLFVVVEYDTSCSNNMKVYRIEPIIPFQVNVLPLAGVYDTPNVDECFDEVQSASFNVANNCMDFDYGTNVLAYEVVAAYFDAEYDASFRIAGLQPSQTADILWSYSNDFSTAAEIHAGVFNGVHTGPTVETDLDDTSAGVSIYVWLRVHHDDYEGIGVIQPISLAVAGVYNTTIPNVRWNDCAVPVDLMADFGDPNGPDYAQYIMQPRPTVTPVGGSFVEACD